MTETKTNSITDKDFLEKRILLMEAADKAEADFKKKQEQGDLKSSS